MNLDNTAFILIGYQNDYFAKDGILHSVIEEASRVHGVLEHTLEILEKLAPTDIPLITTRFSLPKITTNWLSPLVF